MLQVLFQGHSLQVRHNENLTNRFGYHRLQTAQQSLREQDTGLQLVIPTPGKRDSSQVHEGENPKYKQERCKMSHNLG